VHGTLHAQGWDHETGWPCTLCVWQAAGMAWGLPPASGGAALPLSLRAAVTVTGVRQAYQGDFKRLETPAGRAVHRRRDPARLGRHRPEPALDLSASVARQNNFGGLWNAFALRGFVGDENLPSNYLVNGFNAGRGFGGPRDLSGIESVEVLKGPRAALFGRGEPGGTVNLVTKRPTFKTAGEFRCQRRQLRHLPRRCRLDGAPLSDAWPCAWWASPKTPAASATRCRRASTAPAPRWPGASGRKSRLVYELEYSHQEIPFDRGVLAIDGQLGGSRPAASSASPATAR
jgi:iron complex outermembrane recepter protein